MISPIYDIELAQLDALQPDGWNDIKAVFIKYIKEPLCFPIKVEMNNQVVGIGTTIIHNDIAWLGHIIVHPIYRGKGLGKMITQTLLDIAKRNNCRTIYLLATALGAPIYEKVGFITETEYVVFNRLKIANVSKAHSAILPYLASFKQQIAELDRATSAEDRLFYLEQFLYKGFVYVEKDKVAGYYLPDLGEGLIIAQTPAAGLALVKLHLKTHDRLMFPKDNQANLISSTAMAIRKWKLVKE